MSAVATLDYLKHAEWISLYRDILADPLDDTLRLLAADWLDDQGQVERAEFIRVQIELAELFAIPHDCEPDGGRPHPGETTCAACGVYHDIEHLIFRQQELYDEGRAWWSPMWSLLGDTTNELSWWERGFVAYVELSPAQFEQHAAAVALSVPVTDFYLSDRTPRQIPDPPIEPTAMVGWYGREPGIDGLLLQGNLLPHFLPPELWDLLSCTPVSVPGHAGGGWEHWKLYGSPELAYDDLSRACVMLARERAELPPLRVDRL